MGVAVERGAAAFGSAFATALGSGASKAIASRPGAATQPHQLAHHNYVDLCWGRYECN